MTRIPRLIHSRVKRRKKHKNTPLGKAGFAFALLFSLLSVSTIIGLVSYYTHISQDLPSADYLTVLLDPDRGLLMQPTRIYTQGGEEVLWAFENPALEERDYAVLDLSEKALRSDIPPGVVKATIAATDPQYFSRANLNIWDWRQGKRTIPQMLVSDLLLWQEQPGLWREIREGILASQITAQFGREKVLEWYLNSAYYGRQTYGVSSAAEVYFGKPVHRLNLAEAALLAAVSEAPALNPFDAPQAARERGRELLNTMGKHDLITEEEEDEALAYKLVFQEKNNLSLPRPGFVDYVLEQIDEEIPQSRLTRGGFNIITTIDSSLQSQMECAVQVGLARYRGEDPPLEEECEAARLLPNYPDRILQGVEPLHLDVVQLDPRNGHILAVVGEHPNGLSDLFSAHPPGSLLTPFIYLTSFTQGYEPAALVWDIPPDKDDFTVEDLHPGCGDQCAYKGPVSIRLAMANDYLTPALNFWETLRPGNIENILSQVGVEIPSGSCPSCQMFPGSHAVTILDVAQSYGVFSNGGVLRGWPSSDKGGSLEPVIVNRVEDLSGKIWRENPRLVSRAVISKQLAYMITHVLSDSNARRASMGRQNVFDIGRPAAVKLGNTSQEDQIWTVGYTPQIVTAVWMGSEGSEAEGLADPLSKVASGYWRALTQYALKGQPLLGWEQPDEMTTLEVCSPSGLLPTDQCPEVVDEIFIQGNEPTQEDNLYQVLEINRETNQLATVFTPPELIEERTYLNIPPEAEEWARQQGISTPPQQYDVSGQTPRSPEVHISSPENFSFVREEVELRGMVPEEGVLSYRIQFGKGLNPKTWQQIHEESVDPRGGSVLVTWDTRGVEDGLYALQLVVVREGQRVEKASTIVSVDNTPPTVRVAEDLDGRQFTYRPGEEILFRAQVVDNANVDEVTFYLNYRLIATRDRPPYAYPWEMEVGEFTLNVRAVDKAGNVDQEMVTFEVVR
ncbi:MAG: penicillin-binding protein [Chloroflexota bacterium]